jgi:PhzF family phenazine biosynthesis protein
MTDYPFKVVDVFTDKPLFGNPVAVVFNADNISDENMLRIAGWTHLSETTFICASTVGDYRLRIFTPGRELPFAGHPTIGSAHAAIEAGVVSSGRDSFTQDCLSGLIPIQAEQDGVIRARVPKPRIIPTELSAEMIHHAMGAQAWLDPMLIDVGPHWMVARLNDFDALYSLDVDAPKLIDLSRDIDATGMTVYAVDKNAAVHVRSFAPLEGVFEDPVCGSGNAAVAAHVNATALHGKVGKTYTAHQGAALGRDGYIQVAIDGDDVFIGGHSVTVVDGKISL